MSTWRDSVSAFEALVANLKWGAQRGKTLRAQRPELIGYTGVWGELAPVTAEKAQRDLNDSDLYVVQQMVVFGLHALWLERLADEKASVWTVTPDMVDVLAHAAASMQPESLERTDLPEHSAFVWFEKPLQMSGELVQAMIWTTEPEGIFFSSFLAGNPPSVHTSHHIMVEWSWGQVPDVKGDELDERIVAKALWALANQRVTEVEEPQCDRPTKRRMERSLRRIPNIRVVNLRRRAINVEANDVPASNVDWTHRWMVGGHWRNQPHGTNRELRRQQWIAPHVKGPDDKPLVVKRRVVRVAE